MLRKENDYCYLINRINFIESHIDCYRWANQNYLPTIILPQYTYNVRYLLFMNRGGGKKI
jgi:hypothetical protein